MSLYPVNLNIENRLCLVVGGGPVALRKTRGLLQAGARVRVISPKLVPELGQLSRAKKIEWFNRGYAEGDLDSVDLVFAVTDDRNIQHQIAEEAALKNVLLNSADDPVKSRFHVPAHFRRGPLLLTVSTSGGSPALAKKMREKLEAEIGPEYEAVAGLLSAIRSGVIRESGDPDMSGHVFRTLLEKDLIRLVTEQNWFDVQMLLLEVLPTELDSAAIMKNFLETIDDQS